MRRKHKAELVTKVLLPIVIGGFVLISCDSPFGPYDEGPGQAPYDLTAIFLGRSVELNWYTTPDSEESAYIVYRSADDPYHYEEIARINGWVTQYRDANIELDTLYYYKVKTEYNGNPGKDSNEVFEYTAPYLVWFTTLYDSPSVGKAYAYNPGTGILHTVSDIWGFEEFGINTPYGICSDGRYIYLSDLVMGETYISRLNKIDLSTGEIKNRIGPRDFFYRLTYDGSNLWTCLEGIHLLKIDPPTGDIIDQMDISRYLYHGITCDGDKIWGLRIYLVDSHIYCIDVNDGSLVSTLMVDLDYPGLAYDGEYLWGAYRKTYSANTVYDLCRVDPITGSIVEYTTIEIDGPATIADMEIIPSRIDGKD
jgi:hypothetical protein